MVSVVVNGNIDGALRVVKKKMQREGLFREMKLRRHFENNAEEKKRKKEESDRRIRKAYRRNNDNS